MEVTPLERTAFYNANGYMASDVEIAAWNGRQSKGNVRILNTENAIDDRVNNPKHYTVGGIETIDYMKAKSTPEEFIGHLRLTALKYISRAGHKDDMLEDYKKAQWYINKLIEELEPKH